MAVKRQAAPKKPINVFTVRLPGGFILCLIKNVPASPKPKRNRSARAPAAPKPEAKPTTLGDVFSQVKPEASPAIAAEGN